MLNTSSEVQSCLSCSSNTDDDIEEEEEEEDDRDVCLADARCSELSVCRLRLLSLPSIRSDSASSAPPKKKRAKLPSPICNAIIVHRDAVSSPLASKRRGSASAESVSAEEEEEEGEEGIVCLLGSV